MCRKSICLTLSIVVLILSVGPLPSRARADLMLYLPFDEGQGMTAEDLSGNNNNGQIIGEPRWVKGYSGSALEFSGAENTHHVEVADTPSLNPEQEITLLAWIFIDIWEPTGGVVSKYTGSGNQRSYNIHMDHDTNLSFRASVSSDGAYQVGTSTTNAVAPEGTLIEGQWQHIAMTYKGDEFLRLYHNGNMVAESEATATPRLFDNTTPLMVGTDFQIGGNHSGQPREFTGAIDEVRLYDHALDAGEILSAMAVAPYPFASGPSPKDGSVNFDTWATLSWRAGEFAESHDVYLGDDYTGVNNAMHDSEFFHGNQVSTVLVVGFPGFPYPEGLIPGTTYYWRIDEVNDADPNSPWKGPIWSFSIPPKTAFNPNPADGDGIAETTVTLAWTAGFGAKLHTVYFGDDYDTVANATVGMPAGSTSYNPGPLEAEKVYYWRVDEFDGLGTYTGDVWTFTTPGAVGNPQPANGADDVTMATVLSWTAADSATSHEVYLGLDKDAVRSANTVSAEYKGSKALGAESYDAGLLEPDRTYYWRVDEVYTGNTVKGPVWSFTVGTYLLVDDFESYTDDDPNNEAIWQHWIDGFGVADNGAQVGYLMPPYAEQTIVHGGLQSMPLFYTNEGGVTNSEATLTLTSPRDWTLAGVSELSVWFRGASDNAADPLYVAVSNSAGSPAIVAQDDPEAATVRSWAQWRIPLQAFADQGINLSNVDKIAVGVGSKGGVAVGGSGTLYIDDIRLNRP
jgi:hypothetical protein